MVTQLQFTVTEQNGIWQVRVIDPDRHVQEFRCATTDQVRRLLTVLGGSFESALRDSQAHAAVA